MGKELTFTTARPGIGKVLFALFLMLGTPISAMLIWYIMYHQQGSLSLFLEHITKAGPWAVLEEAWLDHWWGSAEAWAVIGCMLIAQVAMMAILPGKPYQGPVTPMGNVPTYKDNGLSSYLISIALFAAANLAFDFAPALTVYQHFGEILAALNVFALIFCLGLYFKGRYRPSSTDHSTSGSFIFDYYWGTELYPRIAGIDAKMLTNCRMGMTGWALSAIAFAMAQYKLSGTLDHGMWVSSGLLVMYLLKFFIWESGYMRSTDIITDRAGYYICWGCLVWVPAVYTSPAFFMAGHPGHLSLEMAIAVFLLGSAAIWINYWADHQRQVFRAKSGKVNIWGKPATFIRATYTTGSGETKENLLLTSGFWGWARHFHYLPELAAAFFWSCGAGFSHFLPFFYVSFLTILLVHRTYRDDEKCQAKYGPAWSEYRRVVPKRLIPFLY